LALGTVATPDELEAELFHHRMKSGRNNAVLVSARGTGPLVQCVIKMSAGLENPSLAPLPYLLEWLAAALASVLEIRVARPYRVVVSDAFARSIRDPDIARIALASLGCTFGSEFGQPPLSQWMSDLPHAELREPAATLLAFDAFVHNPDRRVGNPNVLVGRSDLFAFDHGDAFSFLFAIGGDHAGDPLLQMLEGHALRPWLRRRGQTLDRFRRLLGALTDEVFDAIVAATPAEWQQGPAAGKLSIIVDVLRRRRDAAEQWLPKVEAWLEK
jgi:hypothetical protein